MTSENTLRPSSNVLIIHPFAEVREDEQTETWEALRAIRGEFNVWDSPCETPLDYDDALERIWGRFNIIIIEQDIVPTLEKVRELAECPGIWCCCKYRVRYLEDKNPPYWITTGFGLTKLDVRIQQVAAPSSWHKKGDWSNLDSRISGEFIKAGFNQHVHGEVKHNRVVDWRG